MDFSPLMKYNQQNLQIYLLLEDCKTAYNHCMMLNRGHDLVVCQLLSNHDQMGCFVGKENL